PELHVYEVIRDQINTVAAKLSVALGLTTSGQERVRHLVPEILMRNQDPHLLFRELGDELEFMSAIQVRQGFLSLWAELRPDEVDELCIPVQEKVEPDKFRREVETPLPVSNSTIL